MRHIRKTVVLLICTVGLIAQPALAQSHGSRQTRDFVQAAAQSDEFEIMEAYTALAQSTDPQIRSFAQTMIDAHQKTSDRLRQAVASEGLEPPPPGMDGSQSQFLASLQSQRGPNFDKTYINQQALAHRSALAVEQIYANSGDDPALRQLAASTTSVVSSHLVMAQQMQEKTGE